MLLIPCLVMADEASDHISLQFLADQFLREHRVEEHISGLAVTVDSARITHPLTVYSGTVSTEQEKTVDASSLFQVGSLTKSFIAAVLLQLARDPENHFRLDDPVDKFFPQYSKWRGISVKQLMNMTSGIPDYITDRDMFSDFAAHPYRRHSPSFWVDRMYQHPLRFSPGAGYLYSNTNYLLLGMLIEKLTGHTTGHEIRRRLIKPLGLKNTYYVAHYPGHRVFSRLVRGYQFEKGFHDYIPRGEDVTEYSLSYMDAAGGMISNSADMAVWIKSLFTPDLVLTESELLEMKTLISQQSGRPVATLSVNDPVGFGLGIRAQFGPGFNTSYYIYQGMTLGYRAIYFYYPERQTLISITVNSSFDGKENHLIGLINQIGESLSL
ncbi:D-alanyl-D-alanine carboxypeptidase [Aquicella siphonis]|uniref:D-alanyl-D-alanine carboxypeptidase n=2 Tax=Aquicella siphonis TaxID=254247 RepID=A0A5E4PDX9_9COXI|nr:D-alanyl-D-alanine carboxypeptidase [Aquicella siphonis]